MFQSVCAVLKNEYYTASVWSIGIVYNQLCPLSFNVICLSISEPGWVLLLFLIFGLNLLLVYRAWNDQLISNVPWIRSKTDMLVVCTHHMRMWNLQVFVTDSTGLFSHEHLELDALMVQLCFTEAKFRPSSPERKKRQSVSAFLSILRGIAGSVPWMRP